MIQFVHIHQFLCPVCGASIALPRQSQLGEYEGQQYRPKGVWPINFVCTQRGQTCEVEFDAVHLGILTPTVPYLRKMGLWLIVGGCAHEDCTNQCTIFVWHEADQSAENVVSAILNAKPMIACTWTHSVEFQAEKMTAEKLGF